MFVDDVCVHTFVMNFQCILCCENFLKILFCVILFKLICEKARAKDEQNLWTQWCNVYKLSLRKKKKKGYIRLSA